MSSGLRVLVCGGRDYGFKAVKTSRYPVYRITPGQVRSLFGTLDRIHLYPGTGISCLGEGCAAGADFLGGIWAASRGVTLYEYPADWDRYGGAAGPRRNQYQLDTFNPDVLVAFPGGTGTEDMINRARRAGVRVEEISV